MSHQEQRQGASPPRSGVRPRGTMAPFPSPYRGAGRPRDGGNTLHAAVLGASDGLSSNLSLMMGVAGMTVDSHALLLTGVAGLLGGAFSMAVGEWVSVTTVRECAEHEARADHAEVENALLGAHDLGLDPESLPRPPWVAGVTSLGCFTAGASVPLLPYIVTTGLAAIVASLALGATALFGVGAAITRFTGRSVAVSGGRHLILGLLAAGITFAIGRAIGVALV